MATSFHGYEVKEKIGAGGMSTVYKGIHKTLGYPVAIKILHPGLAGDTSFISRFEREAKAASAIRTSNIASVIDFGSEDDVYFIVMEYIDGKDLGKLFAEVQESKMRHRGFPAEVALMLLEDVADGLKEAHARGIIHRDIKPSNILLNERGEVKIADFGLARDTGDLGGPGGQDLTRPGMVVGTPSYMSPEQAAGRDKLDHRTDIFSLGVMAYQFLSGEKPFQGESPTTVQEHIINDDPPPLTLKTCPLLTPEIETLIDKMLAKDPAKRFQSMDQVRRALSDCLESIDNVASLLKYRRDYLSRFAADPVGTAHELRDKSISNHMKRGYHYKKMGLSNIGDALREFSYVVSLDPENAKAAEAIQELEKKAEESGMRPAVRPAAPDADAGQTMVLPQAGAGPAAAGPSAAARPAPPSARRGGLPPWLRHPGVLGGAAAVVVALLAWLVFFPRGGTAPAEGPAGPAGGPTAAPEAAAPGEGWLVLASEPPGALVGLRRQGEEQLTELAERTPLRHGGLAPGTWEIVLELDGFEAAVRTVSLAGGDTIRQAVALVPLTVPPEATPPPPVAETPASPAPAPTPAGPEPGRIAITTDPAGAKVYLKNPDEASFTYLGTSPFTTGELAPGRWEVRVEMDGRQGRSAVVNLRPGERRDLPLGLEASAPAAPPPTGDGWLRVVVAPYADIYLNNQLVAEGSKVAVMTARAGVEHKVELRHPPTFGRLELTGLKVTAGDTLDVPRMMFRWGALRVGANVAAFVTLDGRELGQQTPYALGRIATGPHTLSVHLAGYRVERAIQSLDDGSRRELRPVNPGSDDPRFEVAVAEDEEVKVRFLLAPVE